MFLGRRFITYTFQYLLSQGIQYFGTISYTSSDVKYCFLFFTVCTRYLWISSNKHKKKEHFFVYKFISSVDRFCKACYYMLKFYLSFFKDYIYYKL